MKVYHNTTNLTGTLLADANRKALRQVDMVIGYYNRHKEGTAWDVYVHLLAAGSISNSTPLSSIRRSISDLKKSGHLEKTEELKPGGYGAAEHIYRLTTTWAPLPPDLTQGELF